MKIVLISALVILASGCSITCKQADPSAELKCNTYQYARSCPAGEVEDTNNECSL